MKNKIAVVIRGGLVVSVFSREDADVVIIDFDNQHPDEEEEADMNYKDVMEDRSMKDLY